ncbi:McrB family protein [Nocardia niigatensis]
MNRNLAGSYAPSSLRTGAPAEVAQTANDGTFSLLENHSSRARKALLFDKRLPLDAFTCFWYRNFAFRSTDDLPDNLVLRQTFAAEFGYWAAGSAELEELFDLDAKTVASTDGDIFESAPSEKSTPSWVSIDNNIQRSAEPVRILTANELGIGSAEAVKKHASNRPDDPLLSDNDPILLEIKGLLELFGGVIFTGPPGTSKSWYASQIAMKLVDGDEKRVRFVQFHPSYQYEDFMQGFVPKKDGTGFTLEPKYFLQLCRAAERNPDKTYVLVIDEFSRGDPGRVFGEALTYVDKTKRDVSFLLASGEPCVVPSNLYILATMNPYDRGVDDVDAAFGRRFAKIAMEPSTEILRTLLIRGGVEVELQNRIITFFEGVRRRSVVNPAVAIGHTYFNDVQDLASLERVWRNQLRFIVESAYRNDPATRKQIESEWRQVVGGPDGQTEQV